MCRNLIFLEEYEHLALDEGGVIRFIRNGRKIKTVIEVMIFNGCNISETAAFWGLSEAAVMEAYIEYINGNLIK